MNAELKETKARVSEGFGRLLELIDRRGNGNFLDYVPNLGPKKLVFLEKVSDQDGESIFGHIIIPNSFQVDFRFDRDGLNCLNLVRIQDEGLPLTNYYTFEMETCGSVKREDLNNMQKHKFRRMGVKLANDTIKWVE